MYILKLLRPFLLYHFNLSTFPRLPLLPSSLSPSPFFCGLLPPSHLPQWLTSNLSIVAHLYLGNTRYLTVSGCFLEPSPCLCSLPLVKFFFFLVCLSSRTCIPTFFVIVYNNSLIDNFLPAAFFWGLPHYPFLFGQCITIIIYLLFILPFSSPLSSYVSPPP